MGIARLIVFSAAVAATAGLVFAGSHGGNPAVKARQSHMRLNVHNIGILGAMAKGEVEYNAEVAVAAASNLAALANLDQRRYWVPGTSTAELGDETRALPAIWEDGSNIAEIIEQLAEATANLAAVAGDGKDALGPALGPVGGTCGACHSAFRKPSS